MESSDLSRDTSGTRAFSQFLVELADKIPSHVLPNISLLMAHLDGEVSSFHSINLVSIISIDEFILARSNVFGIFWFLNPRVIMQQYKSIFVEKI